MQMSAKGVAGMGRCVFVCVCVCGMTKGLTALFQSFECY